MYRLILALAALWCVLQSLYMIWVYHDVLDGATPEDAEDAVTNVKCSHCGYKEYIPSTRLAKGHAPVFAVSMYLLSWFVLILTIIVGVLG